MWKRLGDKYGDPGKGADVIIDGIRRSKMKEGEDKRFVEFVNLVEDGSIYMDLKRLGLVEEITTYYQLRQRVREKTTSTHNQKKLVRNCQRRRQHG